MVRLNRLRAAPVLLAGALALTLSVSACSDTDSNASAGGSNAGSAAVAAKHLPPAEFANQANAAAGTVLLDVRTPEEFASGHLPGAVNINSADPAFEDKLNALDKTKPYAVYCQSGNRSGVALGTMADLGFANAYDLQGGIGAWAGAGGQVVTGS